MKKSKYLWELKSDNELKLWPKTSREHYLSASTLPQHLVSKNRGAKISAPEKLPYDILAAEGILNTAITEHAGQYYQSRDNENFHFALFTLEGECAIKIGGRAEKLKRGTVFAAPAGTYYELRAAKRWKNIWFHISDDARWSGVFGCEPAVKKSRFAKDLEYAAIKYLNEAHKPDRSIRLLEILSELIAFYLRAEFETPAAPREGAFEALAQEMRAGGLGGMTARRAAQICGVSVRDLNALCRKKYAKTFAKLRLEMQMKTARKMLLQGRRGLAEIAAAAGFSTPFALSKAFKKYHGASPARFCKTARRT